MDERKTHYQLSFTGRQALLLFLGLLGALWVAYFLGLRTGLAGHETRGTSSIAAASPDSTPTELPSAAASPTGAAEVQPTRGGGSPALVSPSPPPAEKAARERPVQLFEDRGEPEPVVSPRPPASAPAGGESFWVQVLSTSVEKEARSRVAKLSARGYHASVGSVSGPRGAVYRVRVGPYRSREVASKAAQRLWREEKVRAWIVPPGK